MPGAKATTNPPPQIVGVGMAVYDAVVLTDSYPTENSKLLARESFQQGGGPCATALVAAARLGVPSAYMGTVARDFYGDYLYNEFVRYGVDVSAVRRVPGHTPHSLVLLNGTTGSRTIVWHNGHLEAACEEDISQTMLQNAYFLHLDNHQMAAAIAAAHRAKALGVQVSLDAGSVYPGCEALLEQADILVPSEKFVRQWSGTDDVTAGARQLTRRYAPRLFAVTLGEKGVLYQQGDELVAWPAFKVKALDTNGAGDVFHGALLAALARGLQHPAAVRLAMAVAAMKCQTLGARAGVPRWRDALAFVEAHR